MAETLHSRSDIAANFGTQDDEGITHVDLLVKGIHCPNCIRKIEGGLGEKEAVREARVNFSTSRLHVAWDADRMGGDDLIRTVSDLGFEAMPINADVERTPEQDEARTLLYALAVAGFAWANIMLLSVAVWAGVEMGDATRTLMHWISGLCRATLFLLRLARAEGTPCEHGRTHLTGRDPGARYEHC